MARPERFELPTPWFVARYSIQLSYGRVNDPDYRDSLARGRACGVRRLARTVPVASNLATGIGTAFAGEEKRGLTFCGVIGAQ